MIRVDPSPVLFIFYFSYSIRVGPSRSELIRPGLAVRGDPVRLLYLPFEHMAKFNTKSISNWGTFCNFSSAPKRKIYKTSMKHLKIHKFPFKNVIGLGHRVQNVPGNSAKSCISKQTRAPSWRKQGWIPRKTISWWKPSLPPQNESWAFFSTFSFHFLSFNGVFLTLKCRTLVLKHLHGALWSRGSHFVENGCWSLRFPSSRALNVSYMFQPLMSFWCDEKFCPSKHKSGN